MCLAGCSALRPDLQVPQLTLVSVAMTSADIFNQQFLVKVNVQNPNDRELPITGIDYKLFLEGDSFAEGVSEQALHRAGAGRHRLRHDGAHQLRQRRGRLLSRLNGRDQVNYVVEGKVLTDISMLKKIPFQETGTVTFKAVRQ